MPPPVAVAVVSWNTRELLRTCLESLRAEADAGRAAVWVVDAGSTDGSAELVRTAFPWVSLIERPDNPGYGAAVNLVAAAASEAAWIAPANADVALEPGALAALLEAGARDQAAGAVAPRLLRPDGSTQHSVHPFPTLRFILAFNLGLGALSRRWADATCLEAAWDPERPRRVPWAVGAFLLVRRPAWDAVAGFDPAQWLYAEDLDLGWRLARAGWATRYEPRARVRHHESAAIAQSWGPDERTARWLRATYDWLERRRGAPVARAVAAINVLGAAARGLAPGERGRAARRWARLHASAGR